MNTSPVGGLDPQQHALGSNITGEGRFCRVHLPNAEGRLGPAGDSDQGRQLSGSHIDEFAPSGNETTRPEGLSRGCIHLHPNENKRILERMVPAETDIQAARAELKRVLESPVFAHSERPSRFLRFVVERHLEGRDHELKESVIGSEIFGRRPDYDPKNDSVVRIEARRLRALLNEYYLGEGKSDPVLIELPKGGYVPVFRNMALIPAVARARDVPDPHSTPLDKALAKDPEDRSQHNGDFAIDLRHLQQRPRDARPQFVSKTPVLPWIAVTALLLAMPIVWWAGRRSASSDKAALASDISITPFTTNLGYNGEPTISPDGQTIAYVSDRNGRFDIFLRQIGTTSDVALTNEQSDNIQPTFSPDGRQIAFVSSRAGASPIYYPGFDYPLMGGDIWVMPALGGTARRVAKNGNYPSWSPDGSKIAFVRHRGLLFEVPVSGGEAREIKLSPNLGVYYPAYSSDSRWIFFERQGNGIQAVRSTGGDLQQIASGRHPVWDDTSQAVIYSDDREGNNYSLWSVPFSLKEGKLSGKPRALTVGRGRDWQPAVSRDGKLVAYTAIQISFNLESIPFDAESGRVLGTPRALTNGNQVSYFMRFSPDGRSVVFQSSRGSGQHIWRVDIGSEPVQLTSDPKFEESFPHWSTDGNTIAFVRQPAQSPKSASLWFMDTDGANPRKILDGCYFVRWLPDGSGVLCNDGNRGIFLYELRTGHSRQVSSQSDVLGTMPMPSPDGEWIAYQAATGDNHNIDIHVVGLGGGHPRIIVATPRQDFHPFFSPLGHWLYFQPDHKNLYRVPGPAQNWKQADPARITNFPESGLYLEDPQISRDGKQFLYARGKITGDIWILRRGK